MGGSNEWGRYGAPYQEPRYHQPSPYYQDVFGGYGYDPYQQQFGRERMRQEQIRREQLRRQQEQERLIAQQQHELHLKKAQYKKEMEQKIKEEKKKRLLEIQKSSAQKIQRVWRGHQVRILKIISRLQKLEKIRESLNHILEKFKDSALEKLLNGSTLEVEDTKHTYQMVLSREEELTRCLLSLDEISAGKCELVRDQRKSLVNQINSVLEQLEPLKIKLRKILDEAKSQSVQQPPVVTMELNDVKQEDSEALRSENEPNEPSDTKMQEAAAMETEEGVQNMETEGLFAPEVQDITEVQAATEVQDEEVEDSHTQDPIQAEEDVEVKGEMEITSTPKITLPEDEISAGEQTSMTEEQTSIPPLQQISEQRLQDQLLELQHIIQQRDEYILKLEQEMQLLRNQLASKQSN